MDVKGADRLARTLRAADRDLADMSGPGRDAVQLLARQVSGRAPRRTGRLAGSVRPGGVTLTDAVVLVAAPYAIPVEFGTRRMRARPYFRPAVDSTWDAIVPLYAARVDAALSHVKGL